MKGITIGGRNLKFFVKFRPLIYEIMVRECFLEANSRIAQYTIYTTYDTQQQDACHTSHQADTHGTAITEGRDRLFVRGNEHRLDNQQIVIQGDDGIDQSNEYH